MNIWIKCFGWLLVAVGASSLNVASAQDLPGPCLVSFKVKDTSFSSGLTTMSCRLLEARRIDLTQSILAFPVTGEIDGDDVARKLDALDAAIQKHARERNWLGVAEAITGNALATIGLSTCLESAGAGCLVAGISKLMSLYGMYDAAITDAEKQAQANQLGELVANLRQAVSGKKSKAKAARDRLVTEAKMLCDAIRTSCL